MSIENCRGKDPKQNIINTYHLKPIVYIRLLAGQVIHGCCGKIIDKYYLFEAEHKKTGNVETFSVGYDCAAQFLEQTNQKPLKLFNPFTNQPGQGNGIGGGTGGSGNTIQLHPLNKEVREAIHILCSAWGKAPKGSFRSFLEYIEKRPEQPTKDFAITGVNKVISYDAKNRTLSQIINDLRVKNPNLRVFTFPLMEKILQETNEESFL